ncbi:MAG: M67 family metallopeptidase [Alphaproteobacteria bacterium]|nr:M67 family metallopeptidase [Alphaproteobacteria bacterium]
MTLDVTSELFDALLAEADAAHPRECCGLLIGDPAEGRIDAFAAAGNVHPQPETRFEIDPQALIDAHRAGRSGGPQLVGYYHSHPDGEPRPSATDAAMAAGDGMIWAIIGGGRVAFWHAGRAGFSALPYRLVSR